MRPTIAELIEHANVGTRWRQVGIQLQLNSNKLDAIDDEHKKVADKVLAMYELWLQTNPNASRRQLLKVLRRNNIQENTLAENYEEYIKSVTESTTPQEGTRVLEEIGN